MIGRSVCFFILLDVDLACCSGSFLPALVHFPVGPAEKHLPSSPAFTPTPAHTLVFLFFFLKSVVDRSMPPPGMLSLSYSTTMGES